MENKDPLALKNVKTQITKKLNHYNTKLVNTDDKLVTITILPYTRDFSSI